jgi:hypothetical protein
MLGYFLALVIGLSLGILGGGGSILTIPIFIYVMGFAPKQAIAMSLPVVGATSLLGAIGHWREGNVDWRAAVVFGALAMAGARLGAEVAKSVPGFVQLSLLGIVMLIAAAMMLRPRRDVSPSTASESRTGARRALSVAATSGAGLGVGVLTGLVGIGGGFLFVPSLVLLARLPMKTAVGTSLFVIALSTVAASAGYRGQAAIPWNVVVIFTAVAVVGILAGTRLVRHVSQPTLRRSFAYFLFVIAAFILYQNRGVLAHPLGALRPSSAGTP